MSGPFDSPADRWGLIFYSGALYRRAHTRQEWGQIADAIADADLRHRDGVRGDNAWCTTAVDTFIRLHDADLRTGDDPPRWHADTRLIQAWLGAPSIPDGGRRTVLHDHGWNYTLHPNRATHPADLTMLVSVAQDAGVVGDPLHKVSLLTWVQDGVFRDNSFLVLVWRPDGPALPSGPVRLDELTATSQTPTDRAVAVLTGVASVANRLLAAVEPDPVAALGATPTPPDAAREQSLRQPGRAFRHNTATADPRPALPPPPAPPSPPRHPRT